MNELLAPVTDSVDSLVEEGIPIHIYFDPMSLLLLTLALIAVVMSFFVGKKYI